MQARNMEEAETAFEQAEALDPNHPQMLATRGLLLMYQGRFAEAEAYCRRCLQQMPEFVPAYATLSRLRRGALEDSDVQVLNGLARGGDLPLDLAISALF